MKCAADADTTNPASTHHADCTLVTFVQGDYMTATLFYREDMFEVHRATKIFTTVDLHSLSSSFLRHVAMALTDAFTSPIKPKLS